MVNNALTIGGTLLGDRAQNAKERVRQQRLRELAQVKLEQSGHGMRVGHTAKVHILAW